MRRRIALLAAALLAAAAVTGCGIPEATEVQVDGPGPVAEAGSVNGQGREPPKRATAVDATQLMTNFLAAAAGEPDQAYARVKEYLAENVRGQLPEKQGSEVVINVVRLKKEPNPTPVQGGEAKRFNIEVDQVGVLRADGTLGPPVATESRYEFVVGPVESGRLDDLFVLNAPKGLLLSVDALRTYYQAHTIYFWNTQQTALVPDQRYLPVVVPASRRATEVVGWLIDGPSEWLAPTVARLPDPTELIGTVPKTDGRLEINLSGPTEDPAQLERLATQLAWSLPDVDGQLELKIRSQTRKMIDDTDVYLKEHPVYQLTGSPQRYCVYNGAVHLLDPAAPGARVPIVPAHNRNIISAAIGGTDQNALVAVVSPAGRRQVLKTFVGPPSIARDNQSKNTFTTIRRPVWLRTADPDRPVGLVVADGVLYRFGADAQLDPVDTNVAGKVTAVAVALDGHRIAFIAGGKLYVAAVTVEEGTVTVHPPRRVHTSRTSLSAVDWIGEHDLIVAGSTSQPEIYEITVDSTWETQRKTDVGEVAVSSLAAYPDNPVLPGSSAPVMYETNGVAFGDLTSSDGIGPDNMVGVEPPAPRLNPVAPFYRF
ncbi:LpqB family beta-propeller domain-containing protein [Micromonospora sp. CPCC 206060]|uniref:LpqB family beta-propeller domain-containing protein n=1 Tax=Micromonospora sp. CPCC 206060 TaxID=3122406 RepID=UPI002FF3B2F1